MNDTITITPEERDFIRNHLEDLPFVDDGPLRVVRLLDAIEQTEAENARLQQRVNELLSEELTDGAMRERIQLRGNMHEVLQKNERLTKMVDWLASHTADICASVYQDSYDLHWWTDCEWKEAARQAVADSEVNNDRN